MAAERPRITISFRCSSAALGWFFASLTSRWITGYSSHSVKYEPSSYGVCAKNGDRFSKVVFEYACSYLLEWLFHRRYWTYADWVFSFQDRVSLLSSIGFALLALAFVRLIVPYLRRRIRSGNDTVFFAGSLCIAALIFGDFLLSAAA